eukprot:3274141-Pyramimonas_sp.AAC.1
MRNGRRITAGGVPANSLPPNCWPECSQHPWALASDKNQTNAVTQRRRRATKLAASGASGGLNAHHALYLLKTVRVHMALKSWYSRSHWSRLVKSAVMPLM